ncbi:Serine-threonine/tyrosine-protein kinase, catalytic domain [Dillenia turbinata]|uniref:non-specific serine/threonine protein kinase n=1 Tax=Dillenia turbinata TaxID=194707 RepID=A0AAN8ZFL3_9MAGN
MITCTRPFIFLGLIVPTFFFVSSEASCKSGCDLALASYYVWKGSNLTYISTIFNQQIPEILRYNPNIQSQDSIQTGSRVDVPYSCECLNGDFLGHTFSYTTRKDDTYDKIAKLAFANLTTADWVHRVNIYDPTQIPDDFPINVTINCSCGTRHVSKFYGLFATYPLRPEDNLASVAAETGVPAELLQRYNPGADFGAVAPKMFNRHRVPPLFFFFIFSQILFLNCVEPKCPRTCDLALASYYVWEGTNITFIAEVLSSSRDTIVQYNDLTNADSVIAGTRVNVPFSCDCIEDGGFLGHTFTYSVRSGDTYTTVAETYYSNLTTIAMLEKYNSYAENRIPDNAVLNVTVNCSCGNASVSKDYGLFITYPLQPGENLSSISNSSGISAQLLQEYNPNSNFSSGLVYIPGKDDTGSYRPLKSSSTGRHEDARMGVHISRAHVLMAFQAGISSGAIAGIAVAVLVALILAGFLYFGVYRKKKVKSALLSTSYDESNFVDHKQGFPNFLGVVKLVFELGGSGDNLGKTSGALGGSSGAITGITVDKSVEFSYEELAKATDDFSMANKIGQGGFGAVYYAELRGEKAAIKKMDMQASKEFLAELKVLTHVHHLNLVRLIGYCVEGSLFLVYEYIENGNLSQHLRTGSGREPLPWSTRVQIALDSARGLEYIHEHTVPVYIHRDIKTANILIDKNFRGKVADFGLTKLTEVGSGSLHTRLVGTFGYMPPEYAQYGDVSPKIDVYAFGVVLYELISAKEAIVKTNESITESKGLVGLFEDVFSEPNPRESIIKLVDSRLQDNYPLDSIYKMAQLARACTQELPQLRPSMRSIVVALMTLSSATEDWDVGSFYENTALVNLMSGR